MKEKFEIFQKYNDENSVLEIVKLLDKNKIEYIFNDISVKFDPLMSNNQFGKEFCIKLKKSDFETANKILEENTKIDISSIDKDYYLLHFTDNELVDVIFKRDEWNVFDVQLAQKLLKERGKEISPEKITEIKNERIEELSKPENNQKKYIFYGYRAAIFGGIKGILIGWDILTSKKVLPNGETVYQFSKNDRKHGNRIFIIAIIFTFFYVTFLIKKIFF